MQNWFLISCFLVITNGYCLARSPAAAGIDQVWLSPPGGDEDTASLKNQLRNCINLASHLSANETFFPQLLRTRDRIIAAYKQPADTAAIQQTLRAIIFTLTDSSDKHYYAGKIDLALKECSWALELGKVGVPIDIRPYDRLSYWNMVKGNLNKALYYSLEAIRILEKDGNSTLNERPYDNMGRIYFQLGQMEQSLAYTQKAVALLKKKDTVIYVGLLKNGLQSLIRLNRPKEALSFLLDNASPDSLYDPSDKKSFLECLGICYTALGQYAKAERYYLESLEKAKKMNKVASLITSLSLGKLYVTTKQYVKAVFYLKGLVEDSNRTVVPVSVQLQAQNLLFQADSAMGNYTAAIARLQQYKVLNDSLFNDTRNRQIEELKVQYETEKKDHNIQLLTRRGQLQSATLKQARLLRNVLIGGAIMLALLLILLYLRYRTKQKNNRLLRAQQQEINHSNQELHKLNDQQQKLLAEKEWLLKEVHHRVKNNLQIVISLLNAQSDFLDSPSALHAIRESRERMQAIALIHQQLYQPDNSTLIDMRSYIREMVAYLENGFMDKGKINFQLFVDDSQLDVSQAVPLGLIMNEAITNAIKHGFPSDRRGVVKIVLQRSDARLPGFHPPAPPSSDPSGLSGFQPSPPPSSDPPGISPSSVLTPASPDILLKITDNGQGLPAGFDLSGSNSLGIQLMKLFAEQLEGEIHFHSEGGVEITLLFKQQHASGFFPAFLYE